MKKFVTPNLIPYCAFVLGAVWLITVAIGTTFLWNYQNRPGLAGRPLAHWPTHTALVRPLHTYCLIMAVHPQCPCTRASLGELALLMTRLQGKLSAHGLFYKPKRFAPAWEKTDLWESAARIPDVTVQIDADGVEAQRFGASTSGQSLLYDPEGRLLFSGGITVSRGHWGANRGFQMIVDQVQRPHLPVLHAPVFGCSLIAVTQGMAWTK